MRRDKLKFSLLLLLIYVAVIFGVSCGQTQSSNVDPRCVSTSSQTGLTFVAAGDIMISRGVAGAIDRAGDSLLPFRQLHDLLKSTDFNFANLESPVSGNDNILGKGLIFNAHTKDLVGLTEYNFKVLNLANNHALDQRLPGLRYTQKILKERGITYLGVGENLEEAWQPKVIDIKGVRIGFIGASYASVNDGGVSRNNYVARIEDTERLREALRKLKSQADFIVVTMHAGVEYTRKPAQSQIDFAHTAIDNGADIVIGAHPHWIQTFEQYKDKFIFYSLGNFIFDQEWSRETKEGLVLKIALENQKSTNPCTPAKEVQATSKTVVRQIELIPVVVERFSTPRRASEAEAQQIMKKFEATESILRPSR